MLLAQTTMPTVPTIAPSNWFELVFILIVGGGLGTLLKPLWQYLTRKDIAAAKAHAEMDAAVLSRYDELQQRVQQLSSVVGALQMQIAEVGAENDRLRQENVSLKDRVQTLEAEVRELRSAGGART